MSVHGSGSPSRCIPFLSPRSGHPTRFSLASLLLAPTRWWWALILAALPAHLFAELGTGIPLAMVLSWFVSNSTEALIGAAGVRLFLKGPLLLDDIKQVAVFLVFPTFLGPFLSSFLDAWFVGLNQFGQSSYWEVWQIPVRLQRGRGGDPGPTHRDRRDSRTRPGPECGRAPLAGVRCAHPRLDRRLRARVRSRAGRSAQHSGPLVRPASHAPVVRRSVRSSRRERQFPDLRALRHRWGDARARPIRGQLSAGQCARDAAVPHHQRRAPC